MGDMVDHVAKALKEIYDGATPNKLDTWERYARAAIGAMRDPTEAMLAAPGAPYGGSIPKSEGIARRLAAWQSMIDTALTN